MSCTKTDAVINIKPEVINYGYLGNGAEWDPYCEAPSWGAPLTEEMWSTIFQRTDFMKMSIVRCMINSPFRYYNDQTGEYERDNNIGSLKKELSYCQKNNITVMFGEFNPPSAKMKNDIAWVKMSVKYLNYLVSDCGFTCIKYFIPTNEPDGNWSHYDGDYEQYRDLVDKFNGEIKQYPALAGKIKFAAPDVVLGYKHPDYDMDNAAWISRTSKEMDSLIGVYEIHAYPGYEQVRSGRFSEMLKEVLKSVPAGKKLILGEAGYKAGMGEDTLENKIHKQRLEQTPLITNKEGADCNMLVYEFEYGLDMALLAMEVMNSGGSGVAAWMLDDSHSVGDKKDIHNVKIWGMWNIFGSKVWNMKEEENVRPWYYAWSLMCRYFPAGSDILKVELPVDLKDVKVAASMKDGKLSFALLNLSQKEVNIKIRIPVDLKEAKLYRYEKDNINMFGSVPPKPDKVSGNVRSTLRLKVGGQSLIVVSDI